MEGRKILEANVTEVQKRRVPSKHYVYVIHVTWDDNTKKVVYRRYSRFFDFQNELLTKFPMEAGALDPSERIIPFLPGKIFFGRSHIREVAERRLQPIDQYCKNLLSLPAKISQCDDVLDFFDVEPEDINPPAAKVKKDKTIEKISAPKLAEEYEVIADYKKEDKWDLDLSAGMVVEVLEKSESGWWFVTMAHQQGWVPSTYLKRKGGLKDVDMESTVFDEEKFVSVSSYTASGEDEVSLDAGCVVDVLKKSLDGWWFVKYKDKEGWAPATYLQKAEKAHVEQMARQSGVQIVGKLSDISELLSKKNNSSSNDQTSSNQTMPNKTNAFKQSKSRSLERGGSLRPPPRKNSIKQKESPLTVKTTTPVTQYMTIHSFTDTVGDGLSFTEGQHVKVIEKTESGWWFVQIQDQEGWVPSNYIGKTESSQEQGEYSYSCEDDREESKEAEEEEDKGDVYEVIDYGDEAKQPSEWEEDETTNSQPVDDHTEPSQPDYVNDQQEEEEEGEANYEPIDQVQNFKPVVPPPPQKKTSTASGGRVSSATASSGPMNVPSGDGSAMNELSQILKMRQQKQNSENGITANKKFMEKSKSSEKIEGFDISEKNNNKSKFGPTVAVKSSAGNKKLNPIVPVKNNNNSDIDTSSTNSQNSSRPVSALKDKFEKSPFQLPQKTNTANKQNQNSRFSGDQECSKPVLQSWQNKQRTISEGDSPVTTGVNSGTSDQTGRPLVKAKPQPPPKVQTSEQNSINRFSKDATSSDKEKRVHKISVGSESDKKTGGIVGKLAMELGQKLENRSSQPSPVFKEEPSSVAGNRGRDPPPVVQKKSLVPPKPGPPPRPKTPPNPKAKPMVPPKTFPN